MSNSKANGNAPATSLMPNPEAMDFIPLTAAQPVEQVEIIESKFFLTINQKRIKILFKKL